MNIENELKLIPKQELKYEQLVDMLKKQGISVPEQGKVDHQEDTYFDDKNGTLERVGGSFRIRRKSDKTKITYKIPIKSDAQYKQRKEYEIPVPEEYVQNIDVNLAIELLKAEYPELVFPKNMDEILTVINDRNKTNLTCSDGTVIEMAMDTLKGKDKNGNLYPIRPEIEFETISGNPENLSTVYEAIVDKFKEQVEKNTLSKYARTKKEISEKKVTLGEMSACAMLTEILNSIEYNKLVQKGQILHKYDVPTTTNLDEFKNFDYLIETLEKIKKGEYTVKIPRVIAENPELEGLLKGENYEVKEAINLEEMMCLLLSDVKYKVADETLVNFLNENYYGIDCAMTNRLSHSQQIMLGSGLIAKSSEVGANLEERLTSMISGLSHDIGHVPMAHTLETILNKMDGLFSHELNGKITIDNIFEKSKDRMTEQIKKYFPELDEEIIKKSLERKTIQIEDAVVNHSRKGSEKRSEGVNNQAARETDKICYAASDICDLTRYGKKFQQRDINILEEKWLQGAITEICGGNEDFASDIREQLDKKYISHLKQGNYGRAVVNAINSIEGTELGGITYYDVNPKIWKFIEKLIARVKDVRENMGIEQAKTEMSKAAMSYIMEEFYKEYNQNNGNIDLAWDNLLKNITNMGELDILTHIYNRNKIRVFNKLKDKETISPEEAKEIVNAMSESIYDTGKIMGKTDEEALKEAEKRKEELDELTPAEVLENFKNYKPNRNIPIESLIAQLQNRADVQLKMHRYQDSAFLCEILLHLGINSLDKTNVKIMHDEYYSVRGDEEAIQPTIAKIRQVEGEKTKKLIVKVPIKKNVSERMTKKYEVEVPSEANLKEALERLEQEHVGVNVELQGEIPYETIDIHRMELARKYGSDNVVFTLDSFNGENGVNMQEIEIKCPEYPKAITKIKSKLKSKYQQYFITASKIDRVQKMKNNGLSRDE